MPYPRTPAAILARPSAAGRACALISGPALVGVGVAGVVEVLEVLGLDVIGLLLSPGAAVD